MPFVTTVGVGYPSGRRYEAAHSRPELDVLAAQVAVQAGVTVSQLRGRGRTRRISLARRQLVDVAIREQGLRPSDVNRLSIDPGSVSAHLRALERAK